MDLDPRTARKLARRLRFTSALLAFFDPANHLRRQRIIARLDQIGRAELAPVRVEANNGPAYKTTVKVNWE